MTGPLAMVGNVNVDLILGPVSPWPKPGGEVFCPQEELRIGGAAGNVALAWAGLGVPFQIAANSGPDQFGDWLRQGFGPAAEAGPAPGGAPPYRWASPTPTRTAPS